ELGVVERLHGGVVADENRLDVAERGPAGILAVVVVEGFERGEGDAVQGACGLVAKVRRSLAGRWRNRSQQAHPHQTIEALVEQLSGYAEKAAQLGSSAGRQALMESPADRQEHGEGKAFSHGFGEAVPGCLRVAEVHV